MFVYDKRKLTADKLPKSMMDLADPSWKGRWAASPSGADFQAIVAAMLQLKGEQATADWLKAMKTNSKAYRGNGNAMKGVNSGEVEGAVIYHYYIFGDQAKTGENSNNIAIHYFRNQDPGAFLSLSGGGVLASSKKKPQAQAFLKWIAGKGGQDVLKNGDSFEYAVSKGAESHPKLEPHRQASGAQGPARQAEQQESHRPDDGRRPVVRIVGRFFATHLGKAPDPAANDLLAKPKFLDRRARHGRGDVRIGRWRWRRSASSFGSLSRPDGRPPRRCCSGRASVNC